MHYFNDRASARCLWRTPQTLSATTRSTTSSSRRSRSRRRMTAAPTPTAAKDNETRQFWEREHLQRRLGTCVNCKATFAAKWDGLGNGNWQRQPTTATATWNWVKATATANCKLRLHNSPLAACNVLHATCRLCHWSKAESERRLWQLRCVMDRGTGWEREEGGAGKRPRADAATQTVAQAKL